MEEELLRYFALHYKIAPSRNGENSSKIAKIRNSDNCYADRYCSGLETFMILFLKLDSDWLITNFRIDWCYVPLYTDLIQ